MAPLYLMFALVVLCLAYKAIAIQLRKKLVATLTAMDDLTLLGNVRKDGQKICGTAVICGGSLAGLLSARVCSDHFTNVVIVEPEEWVTNPDVLDDEKSAAAPQKRSRVPQYTTFHGFQSFMTLVMRQLFGNLFDAEVATAGACFVHADGNLHWSGIPLCAPWHMYTADTFPTVPNITRPTFETLLRRLVLSTCPTVRYVAGMVTGLVRSETSSDVIDLVRVRSRDAEEDTIPAALVVDCTGPALGGFRWLQSLSSSSTTSTVLENLKVTYNPKLAYSTCSFTVPPTLILSINALGLPHDFETGRFLLGNFPDPSIDTRVIGVTRKESNIFQFVCGGWDFRGRMTCVKDMQDFLSEMTLSQPLPGWLPRLLDLLEEERVPATFVHARCPPSAYVQYHLADNIPSNFVAVGDSVMQVNPIRGQGVAKLCVEAVTLNALLARCAPSHAASVADSKGTGGASLPKDLSRTYFSSQAKRTGSLWDTYKSEDYAWKSTIPVKGDDIENTGAWRRAFGSAIIQLVLQDREVAATWWHVLEWRAPPTDLLSLGVILKLVWMKMRSCM